MSKIARQRELSGFLVDTSQQHNNNKEHTMSMSRKNYQQMVKALASSAEHHVNNKRGFHVTCIAIAGQFFMDNIQFDFFKFYAALGEATANIEWRSACVGMMCPVCEVAMCPDCEVAGYTSDTATTKMLAQS